MTKQRTEQRKYSKQINVFLCNHFSLVLHLTANLKKVH